MTRDARSLKHGTYVHMSGEKETPETDDGEGFEDEDEDWANQESRGFPKTFFH